MKIKFFSNYHDAPTLLTRILNNYYLKEMDLRGMEFTLTDDYDVAVIFNTTSDPIKDDVKKLTICQEPHNATEFTENRYLYESDYVFVHDVRLFPFVQNAVEFPSIMFYHDHLKADFFLGKRNYKKKKKISFVVSNKNFYVGHTNRLILLDKILCSDLDIDIYGRGLETLFRNPDKRYKGAVDYKYMALEDYEYSLCFENSYEKNYLTEKFIDCVICNTIPVYAGAPNAAEIFHQGGFTNLDITSSHIIEDIRHLIEKKPPHFNIYNEMNKDKYFTCYNIINILKSILL